MSSFPSLVEGWRSTMWKDNGRRTYRQLRASTSESSELDEEVELLHDKVLGYNPGEEIKVRRWTRRTILCLVLLLPATVAASLLLYHAISHLLIPGPPTRHFNLGPGVQRSSCCSARLSNVPQNDVLPIHAHAAFRDADILEQWIAYGKLPKPVDLSKFVRIDAVTTWVNGSDERHLANRLSFGQDPQHVNTMPVGDTASSNETEREATLESLHKLSKFMQNSDNRFRDFDELRYAVRSTRKSLSRNLGTHHIVSTDFWLSALPEHGVEDNISGNRRGQVPLWIDQRSPLVAFGERQKTNVPAIRMHHDWDIFVPFHSSVDIDDWRAERLPTFSSLAVEAMIGLNMPGLAQVYILSSDDMFLLGNLTISDFYTPLFGPVVHFDMTSFYNGFAGAYRGHETTGFHYDVTLLKKRFGTPGIPYPVHINKANVQPLTVEARTIWREEFDQTSSKRFRGDGWMINSHSLTYVMQIERHREALLWSYLVAKVDTNGDGLLDERELGAMLAYLGASNISSTVKVRLSPRSSNTEEHRAKVLNATRFPLAGATKHTFSSFDGYPYLRPIRSFTRSTGLSYRFTPFSLDDRDKSQRGLGERRFTEPVCDLNLLACWPRDARGQPLVKTASLFAEFAFQNRACGDCLITHLVGKSGKLGLQAFLPAPELTFPAQAIEASRLSTERDEPTAAYHLPLTKSWTETNFSLAAVAIDNGLGKGDDRKWALPSRRTFAAHLLARYTYSLGTSSTKLVMINKPKSTSVQLRRLKQLAPQLSFFCINDDIETTGSTQAVKDNMQGFFESLWPTRTTRWSFEKPIRDLSQIDLNAETYVNL